MGNDKELKVDPRLYSVIEKSIEVGVRSGVKDALKDIEREKEEKKKHKADMRYRNTELLLHNYNNFKKHTKSSIYTEKQLSQKELLDELDIDMDEEITKTQINSIIKSKNKTSIILKHIDTFLEYYKHKCLSSGREDIERRWKIIDALFLKKDEEKITQENIAVFLHCNERTIRNTKTIAIKELSALFFRHRWAKIEVKNIAKTLPRHCRFNIL